jgi:pyridinium-3,5-bisthiocarboxylic acid mononucleotide nickel chelatase
VSPTRVAWFHCFAGIAGDMALGSLVDAGADQKEVVRILERLPLGGWHLEFRAVQRGGIAGTQAMVDVTDDNVLRTFPHIVAIIEEARLPDRVRERALTVFGALATVEGQIHRRPPEQVHFHEVGGHDAIIDIVGVAAALEVLDIDEVTSSPVTTGTGVIRSHHGILPNPAPAVTGLLQGAALVGRDINVELTTPTGAAILATMATGFGPIPAMIVESTGYGAGSRDMDGLPNLTQVVVGTRSLPGGASELETGEELAVLETNVDDATGEQLAHSVEALLAAGALDVWVTPVLMKKGRPGHVVSALCDVAIVAEVRATLLAETGSFGARLRTTRRFVTQRSTAEVEVDGRPVRIKVSPGRAKAELDDAARIARLTHRPVREVIARAEDLWRNRPAAEDDDPA